MHGKLSLLSVVLILGFCVETTHAQKPVTKKADTDTSFTDYDALFNDLDAFLDSITAPRSFTLFNIRTSSNYYDFESKTSSLPSNAQKITYTPTVAYFDKSGFSLMGSEIIVHDGEKLNPYQFNISAGYDYTGNKKLMTGLSYTRFITKNNLPFYTSPLQNELYGYFTLKKIWFKPSLALSYGWGGRSAYEERKDKIISERLARNGYTTINTTESVNDLNLVFSVRHDFYWLNVFGKKDYVRLTPQVVFTSGTQKFGFNQTSNSYIIPQNNVANVLYNSDHVYLDNKLVFQPLVLAAYFKTEYSFGKFFIQPQVLFDYYFPAHDGIISSGFVLNAGVIF